MIVKANNNGISIDVTGNDTLIEQLGTRKGTIPRSDIAKMRIHERNGVEMVEVVDIERREYYVLHSVINTYNGVPVSFTDVDDLFNTLNSDVFGL